MCRKRKSSKKPSGNFDGNDIGKNKLISLLSVKIVALLSLFLVGVLAAGCQNGKKFNQESPVEKNPAAGMAEQQSPGVQNMAKSIENSPLSDLPEDYTPEQAEMEGCFVLVEGEIFSNKIALLDFVETTSRGYAASLRIVNYFEELGNEALITDIDYDGEIYHYYHDETRVGGQEQTIWQDEFTYLNQVPEADLFYLAEDNDITYDEYRRSLISSHSDDLIHQTTLFWGKPSFEVSQAVHVRDGWIDGQMQSIF